MTELLLRSHLGLGDHIVGNGLVRSLAEKKRVCVLVKNPNVPSVSAMFKDLPNVDVFGVTDDSDADAATEHAESFGFSVMRIGLTGPKPFNIESWDKEFYRQAGVPFEDCYHKFKLPREWATEISVPDREYIFIHEDKERGFTINPQLLKKPRRKRIYADRSKTNNILDWRGVIENAAEIHVIDSCFAILVDHLPDVKAKRVVLHDYARQGKPPSYRRPFERIA